MAQAVKKSRRHAAGKTPSARFSGTRRRSAGRRSTRTSRWTPSRRCTATSRAARVARPLRGRPRPVVGGLDRGCARPTGTTFRDPGQMWERTYYQTGHRERAADRGRGAHRPPRARVRRLHARVGRVPAQAPPGAGVRRARHLARARERRARHAVGHGHPLRRARGGDEAAPGAGLPALRHGPRGALRRVPGGAVAARASCTTTPGSPRAATSSACARRRTGASACSPRTSASSRSSGC